MAKKRYSDKDLGGPAPEPTGLLRQAGGVALSGLSATANLLDVPGSMARDVIGGVATGNWSKYNPLDQLAHPFREVGRVRGRDLNRDLGLAGPKDTIGNWWGGLATEIATDPLTALTMGGGAIAKGVGTTAAKAGIHGLGAAKIASTALGRTVGPREARLLLTPSMIAQHAPEQFKIMETVARNPKAPFDLAGNMNEPLGALAKVWPLGNAGLIGRGKTAQKIAQGLDYTGDTLRHTKIPGTSIRPVGDVMNLINAKAGKATSAETLQHAYHAHQAKEGVRYEANLLTAKWTNDLIREGHKATDALEVRNWFEFPQKAPAEVQPLVHEVRQYIDRIPAMARELGVKIGDVTEKAKAAGSDAQYFMRQLAEGLATANKKTGGRPFDPHASAEMARMEWTHGSKLGTLGIAKMAQDPLVEGFAAAKDRKGLKDYIAKNYSTNLPGEYLSNKQINFLKKHGVAPTLAEAEVFGLNNPAFAKRLKPKNTYGAAASSLIKMKPETRQAGIYANHPINDFAASVSGTLDKITSSKLALEHLAEFAAYRKGDPDTVPVKDILKELDLDAGDGATFGAAKWLADKSGGNVDLDSAIPTETAQYLTQMHEGMTGGARSVHAMVKLYDNIANLTKIVFTNADPVRFNVRNRASGYAANILGHLDSVASGASRDANKLIRGEAIPGAAQNHFIAEEAAKRGIQSLDDERATQILGEMLYAREATGSYGVSNLPVHGQSSPGGQLQDVIHGIPGGEPFRWGNVGNKLLGGFGNAGTTWNPITSYRGVGGAETTKQALVAAGEDISHWTESMNRIAPMWALMQNGVHPDEAIRRVLQAQVGYQGRFYTKFEQDVIKRVMLFWSFSKGMFPFTLQQLVENPGGRLAQTLRAMNRGKGEDELIPQHVAETASIPVPSMPGMKPLEPGAKRYVTGFGMGFEDPAQFAVPSFQNAMLEGMSRMNPLLKGPLEAATGQSFFQRGPGGGGRSLEDLDPVLGRTLANIGEMTGLRTSKAPVRYPGSGVIEHMLSNSPLSNLLTKARTATDTRKGLAGKAVNLLTGVKVTDVSPQAQDKELRGRVSEIEKRLGARTYVDTYFPTETKAEMSPKERALMTELLETRKLLTERSKARKKK